VGGAPETSGIATARDLKEIVEMPKKRMAKKKRAAKRKKRAAGRKAKRAVKKPLKRAKRKDAKRKKRAAGKGRKGGRWAKLARLTDEALAALTGGDLETVRSRLEAIRVIASAADEA
jgi:hypothetical protein